MIHGDEGPQDGEENLAVARHPTVQPRKPEVVKPVVARGGRRHNRFSLGIDEALVAGVLTYEVSAGRGGDQGLFT